MNEEAKDLAREFSTPARQLKVVQRGETIAEPLIFKDRTLFHRLKELRFNSRLNAIIQASLDAKDEVDIDGAIDEAVQDLRITRVWVDQYFRSDRYRAWITDREKEIEAQESLSVARLRLKHWDNLEGRVRLTSSQLASAQELGDRIWPKISKIEHEISQKENSTLDDLPDYQKRVDEFEQKLKESIPPPHAA